MTTTGSSAGLCPPGEHEHTEVDKERSKDSPLIRFHVKQKLFNTASDWKLFLWQWNIPGLICDMLVAKGSLKLPECCCLVILLLRFLQLALWPTHTGPKRERTTKQLGETVWSLWVSPSCVNNVPFRSYLQRRTLPQVTLGTHPLLPLLTLPPLLLERLIYHLPVFSCQNLDLKWNTVSEFVHALYVGHYHSTKTT